MAAGVFIIFIVHEKHEKHEIKAESRFYTNIVRSRLS